MLPSRKRRNNIPRLIPLKLTISVVPKWPSKSGMIVRRVIESCKQYSLYSTCIIGLPFLSVRFSSFLLSFFFYQTWATARPVSSAWSKSPASIANSCWAHARFTWITTSSKPVSPSPSRSPWAIPWRTILLICTWSWRLVKSCKAKSIQLAVKQHCCCWRGYQEHSSQSYS